MTISPRTLMWLRKKTPDHDYSSLKLFTEILQNIHEEDNFTNSHTQKRRSMEWSNSHQLFFPWVHHNTNKHTVCLRLVWQKGVQN